MSSLDGRRILLIVGGGIAAYKSLDLIRRLRERGASVRVVLTAGGAQFVTPLSLSALSEDKVYQSLFDLTDEAEMGHIQLSRQADLLVVAPATADLMARHRAGMADDLATTVLLATDKPVLMAPAMNVRMWDHPATQENIAVLREWGVIFAGPDDGAMACGEYGPGRLIEPMDLVAAIDRALGSAPGAVPQDLAGRTALVTSGPTHEPIDPVRFIANRSSGKQGHAIAAALAARGAHVTLVTGPTMEPPPRNVASVIDVESAADMEDACHRVLPVDIAVCAAAVADWRVVDASDRKLKKQGEELLTLTLQQNPDILAGLSREGPHRPQLVVGFAAETEDVIAQARSKRARKGCDWIVANDVSPGTGTFGGGDNAVHLLTAETVDSWPRLSKAAVGERLAAAIADHFAHAAAAETAGTPEETKTP